MTSQLLPVASNTDAPMQPEFPQHHEQPPPFQVEQLLQVLSNTMLQISHTNQAMLSFLSVNSERSQDRPNSRVRMKSFSGLSSEDVFAWLDYFEMISSYHQWSDVVCILLENVAATWYVKEFSDFQISDFGSDGSVRFDRSVEMHGSVAGHN